ncbi:MAG: hypothetical protein IJI16_02470, partial [Atopobiaceae bacterium]|nr:hypothetical protein [Atopobiaceae bacterium]
GGDPYVYTKVANPMGNPAASGYYEIEEGSYETSNVMVISVAPGITTSGNAGVGLVVPIIVMENTYKAEVADNVNVEAYGDVIVTAQNDAKLLPISFSVGAGEQAGVGGTVQALVQKTETIARVGKAAKLIAANGLARVAASSTEFMVNVLASAAASTKVSVAAVINACITRSVTNAIVDEGAYVKANKDVSVTADSESFMVAVSVSLAGSSQTAAGAVVHVFVFDRDVHALVAKGVRLISETGDVLVDAKAKDYTVIVTVGGAASGNAALSGTIPVIVSTNRIGAIIGTYRDVQGSDEQRLDAAGTELRAAGSIGVLSDYDTKQYVAAGGFAGGSAAVGATVLTTVITNEVLALVGFGATVNAGGAGYGIAVKNREARRKGVSVSATSNETFLAVAISGAGGDNVAVAGVVNTGVFSNVVHAIIYGGGTVTANSDDAEGDLGISAASNSNIYMVAGSLDGAGTAGVGATVTVFTYDKDVVASANAHATGTINARNVEVKAGDTHVVDDLTEGGEADSSKTSDRLYLFAVSISGAGTAAVGAGATVLYFDNSNVAELGGTVIATGDVTVRAENDSHLINANGAVAGSGTGSVTGVVAVTYFRTSTIARIVEGSSVRGPAREYAGNVSVTAESKERVDADVVGITGSGTAAVSGTVAVVITNVTVKAYVGTEDGDATPTASTIKGASLKVIANDDFTMLGIAGTAAVGTAGVGVTAVIAKTSNTVEAYVGRLTNVMCVGDVDIKALGNR